MKQQGFQHEALIYDGAEEYLAGTVPFLRAGLERGERILVAVGPEQTDLLQRELGADARRIAFADMREVGRNPASIVPLWRQLIDEAGGAPVWGIGEPVWASRSEAALEECRRQESLLNLAFEKGPAWSLLCPYDAVSIGDDILEKVALSHPCLQREGHHEPSASFERNFESFAGELEPPRGPVESLHFGLAGLGEVRRRVAATAERAGMGPTEIADLVTATSELAANSVMHGGGQGMLRLWREDERLLAEVEDRGRIDDPLVGLIRPDVNQEGGRGLWLANQLCDLIQIRSGPGGTTVRLHLLAYEAAFV